MDIRRLCPSFPLGASHPPPDFGALTLLGFGWVEELTALLRRYAIHITMAGIVGVRSRNNISTADYMRKRNKPATGAGNTVTEPMKRSSRGL